MDFLEPRACILRSVALCLFLPVGVESEDERRWDSERRRCRARSCFRRVASDVSSSLVGGLSGRRGVLGVLDGGLEL